MTATVSPAHLSRLARDLTGRDAAVLDSLYRLRLLTTRMIEELHFRDGAAPAANARACRRTMARLRNAKLTHPLERRIGGVRAGSAGMVWALGVAGQRLLAHGGVPRKPWTPSAAFVDHRLAISRFYCDLVGRIDQPGRLVRFEAEPDCWRRYPGPGGATTWSKPDAFAVIRHDGYDEAFACEIDMATQSPTVIARKTDAYLDHLRSGQLQKELGVYPYVVFLAPHEDRCRRLDAVLRGVKSPDPGLFRTILQGEAAATLLGGVS